MSETLKNIRLNVLTMLGDTLNSDGVFSRDKATLAIKRNYELLTLEMPTPYAETVSAVSLAADVSDYTLPTTASVEYKSILYIKIASLGWTLNKVSMPEMAMMRLRNLARGRPQYWASWEDASSQVNIRVYPTPSSSVLPDTLDVFTSAVGLDLSLDADVVPWQKPAIRILEIQSAIDLLSSVSDSDAEKLSTGRSAIGSWSGQLEQAKLREKRRHGNIVNQRRVRSVVR